MEIFLVCSSAHHRLAKYAPLSKSDLYEVQERYAESVDKLLQKKQVKGKKQRIYRIAQIHKLNDVAIRAKSSSLARFEGLLTSAASFTSREAGRKNELTILDRTIHRILLFDTKSRELVQDDIFSQWVSQTNCIRVWKRPQGYLYISDRKESSSGNHYHFGVLSQESAKPKTLALSVANYESGSTYHSERDMQNIKFTKTHGLAVFVAQDVSLPPRLYCLDILSSTYKVLLGDTQRTFQARSVFTVHQDAVYVLLEAQSKLMRITGLNNGLLAKLSYSESPSVIGVKEGWVQSLESCDHGLLIYRLFYGQAYFFLVDPDTMKQVQLIQMKDNTYHQTIFTQRTLVFKTKLNLSVVLIMTDTCLLHLLVVRPGALHLVLTGRTFSPVGWNLPYIGFVNLSSVSRGRPTRASQKRASVHHILCFDGSPSRNMVIRLRLP